MTNYNRSAEVIRAERNIVSYMDWAQKKGLDLIHLYSPGDARTLSLSKALIVFSIYCAKERRLNYAYVELDDAA